MKNSTEQCTSTTVNGMSRNELPIMRGDIVCGRKFSRMLKRKDEMGLQMNTGHWRAAEESLQDCKVPLLILISLHALASVPSSQFLHI